MNHLTLFALLGIGAPLVASGSPLISEFLAANRSGQADGDGSFSDWIELYNAGGAAIDLQGYILADADGEWVFPESTPLPAGGRLLVFASGREAEEPAQDAGGNWHTDFRLAREGESLSLAAPSGEVLSSFEAIPDQRTDISFGVASNGRVGYFEKPTPGVANGVVTLGFVGDTKFSVDRGYHAEAFELTISAEPGDATILYTTDGTAPDKGTIFTGAVGELYTRPIRITETTVVRALAYKDGWKSSNIDAQTYLFLGDILQQPLEAPEGYAENWGGQLADYGMDPEVVNDPEYKNDFDAAFQAFPTLSIAMDPEDLFGRKGIYQNTTQEGPDWERATSVEFLFPDGSARGFQVPCGIRIQGGSSRQVDIPKHSFSLRFREEYGLGELDYPFFEDAPFGESAVDSFDYLQLRAGFNFAWTHRHYYQSRHAQYNRDQFVNDLYLAMGHPGVHGRWFHCYINGLYWGIYHAHERPDANFMASYFGGSKEDYDAVNSGQATDGDLASWNALWALARNAEDEATFADIEENLDVAAFIDYMLLNFYVGNWDWDGHNWRAAGRHDRAQAGGWYFFPWDSEFAISPNGAGVINSPEPIENALTIDRTRVGGGANRPTGLHQLLLDSPVYRQRLADRVQKHFFHGGVFTPERARAIWKARSDVMDRAIIAESARWGDYKRDRVPGRWPAANYALYTKNDHYLPNQEFILERYLPERPAIVLEQLRDARLIATLDAPSFEVGGEAQYGGAIARGEVLRLAAKGPVFYTVDGRSDPRDADALRYDAAAGILLEKSALVRARSQSLFGQWSPLSEAFFLLGQPASASNLFISEIHFHPGPPSESERAAGHVLRSAFEFLEFLNTGDQPINLVGVEIVSGVEFDFADDYLLEPGERMLLVHDEAAFAARYPGAVGRVAGEFKGSLRNSGETLEVLAADGGRLLRLRYDDGEPWPEEADGSGPSLVWRGADFQLDTEDGSNWVASVAPGGSPGEDEGEEAGGGNPAALHYDAWRAEEFSVTQLEDETFSGPLGDGDRDGRPTLFEFVAGSSPRVADPAPFLELVREEAGGASIRWVQRRAMAGATFALEVSADLQNWEPIDAGAMERSEAVLDAVRSRVSLRLDGKAGARYVRATARIGERME